ncbi:MAG TPA: ABC transporter permease [Vitreimonas sp.]|nr:ABC transporter permease [Vitreimonas sp.]
MPILNALITIAARDVLKLLKDRSRLIASFIFPLIFIGALGGSLDANLSNSAGYDFLLFVFTGVIGQSMFQSTASGIISLIEDKQTDFAQELFVAPIPRWVIVLGKIIGESIVSLLQLISIILVGMLMGIFIAPQTWLILIPVAAICCLMGGAFGTFVMANMSDQRKANQLFPFLIFPQFFLAGVFSPIKELPWYLWILSRIAPMTYAVDLFRSVYYWGRPEYDKVVLFDPWVNLLVAAVMFVVMMGVGTYFFVKNERER